VPAGVSYLLVKLWSGGGGGATSYDPYGGPTAASPVEDNAFLTNCREFELVLMDPAAAAAAAAAAINSRTSTSAKQIQKKTSAAATGGAEVGDGTHPAPKRRASFSSLIGLGDKSIKIRFRAANNEQCDQWVAAIGHQATLLGSASRGCERQCPLLKSDKEVPMMEGEAFVECDEVGEDMMTRVVGLYQLRRITLYADRLESAVTVPSRSLLSMSQQVKEKEKQEQTDFSKRSWKVLIGDYLYRDGADDVLNFSLRGGQRNLNLQAIGYLSKSEWREAFRRVLCVTSSKFDESDFIERPSGLTDLSGSTVTVVGPWNKGKECVLVVQNNQAPRAAGLFDAIFGSAFASSIYSIVAPGAPQAPVPQLTPEMALALEKISLKSPLFFQGVWLMKKQRSDSSFKRRFCWINPTARAFVWAKDMPKTSDRSTSAFNSISKALVLFLDTEAQVEPQRGRGAFSIKGGGYFLDLVAEPMGMETANVVAQQWVALILSLRR